MVMNCKQIITKWIVITKVYQNRLANMKFIIRINISIVTLSLYMTCANALSLLTAISMEEYASTLQGHLVRGVLTLLGHFLLLLP